MNYELRIMSFAVPYSLFPIPYSLFPILQFPVPVFRCSGVPLLD